MRHKGEEEYRCGWSTFSYNNPECSGKTSDSAKRRATDVWSWIHMGTAVVAALVLIGGMAWPKLQKAASHQVPLSGPSVTGYSPFFDMNAFHSLKAGI